MKKTVLWGCLTVAACTPAPQVQPDPHYVVGQAWQAGEHPRGGLGVHRVSDGGTRHYRAHFRDPSCNNLQAVAAMCEGGRVADVVVAVASLDPVLGGVDR